MLGIIKFSDETRIFTNSIPGLANCSAYQDRFCWKFRQDFRDHLLGQINNFPAHLTTAISWVCSLQVSHLWKSLSHPQPITCKSLSSQWILRSRLKKYNRYQIQLVYYNFSQKMTGCRDTETIRMPLVTLCNINGFL